MKSVKAGNAVRALGGMLLALLLAVPASGQIGRADLAGTIYDSEKGVLPGASVTATAEATGISRTAVTGPEGRFVLPNLTPGRYTLTIELSGFQTQTRAGIQLAVGQELIVDSTLQVGGLAENVTVTGDAPVVEVTSTRVGTNISNQEIDSLPSVGRNQLALMQLVPGLTPSLDPGQFEGGQYNANGRETGSNVFMIDGMSNHSVRNGGGFGGQARVTLDSMAEFQVLTHQYGAEYGGSSGVVVNAVSRSGSNQFTGRGFFYYQDESLNAVSHFAKLEGEGKPESGSKIYGFNAGGPIIRNKAFWFFNVERSAIDEAVTLIFPAEAAPLATNFSDAVTIRGVNTFLRTDYQVSRSHNLSFKWVRQATLEIGDAWEETRSTHDNIEYEDDAGDQMASLAWMWVIGSRATNEFKVGHVRQSNLSGGRPYFDDGMNFIGLAGRDQFDIGSNNQHPDFAAGPRPTHGLARERMDVVENTFTITKDGWAGAHTFKAGVGWRNPAVLPAISGNNDIGTFAFQHNFPFDPANPSTYPSRFNIRLGEIYFNVRDWQLNW
jgi:hypothetical protein